MLIKSKQKLANLITDLNKIIKKEKDELFRLNKKITLDTAYWIAEDYDTMKSYLKDYIKNLPALDTIDKIKPKGKILIILSYNEPFILSIIPVLNALIIGNEVILKPSQGAEDFAKIIWQKSGLAKKYGLKLQIISPETHKETEGLIREVRAVYFFGSFKVAQRLAKICGKCYAEFYPEIETADVKIFNKNLPDVKKDVLLTLRESLTHSGQSCQRIQGIFVHKNLYNDYIKVLKQKFISLCNSKDLYKFIDDQYILARKNLLDLLHADIEKSEPAEVVEVRTLPLLIIKPETESDLVKNAYFLPVLWTLPFESEERLIKILNSRKFFLGINIQSDNENFIKYIINNTRFTRYTVNSSHINIRPQEGWGGSWPSGFSGYRSWIEHFSDGCIIIDES
ncbi:MAG: aldehyde dehydrogenase family protein [Patescibacteria group bacterium]|nr:aldehyde dehydrogenase family protein [Patescibacteria group bacterium]